QLAASIVPQGFDEQQFEGSVRFLNHRVEMPSDAVDWRSAGQPKLWRYNLHYFDYLLWPRLPPGRKQALLSSWIADIPVGAEDAWEPYTVSLRVVNWVKFLAGRDGAELPPDGWVESLAMQAGWLSRNLETHILANHYLKNAKALVFAGAFFEGQDADRWLNLGTGIFAEQIDEQFLPGGAHYELSPMYHCICCEDLLDVLNLAKNNPALFDDRFLRRVEDAAARALDFLSAILMPDGRIPLFNDSAFAIAPEPQALFDYGQRLFGYLRPTSDSRNMADAGYFVLGSGADRMIVDCGPVSPSYQPGHTHCDMLSFELALAGRRVFVDAGVHDYEDSPERAYCRSTAAHNTVSVDGENQSELWSVFRVARRANVVGAVLRGSEDGGSSFEGEIAAFPTVKGRVRHRRRIDYRPASGFTITDQVSGSGRHKVDSWLHLHPDMDAGVDGQVVNITDGLGVPVATVHLEGDLVPRLEKGWHFPEFGVRQENIVIRLTLTGDLPATLAYRIEKAAG
ncbi:MAG: alginate lyase family protein, partial [Pseudomonadales bacterium]|nr:alginate lyase family protein [Pseudomonadales bacterium]